MRLRFAPSPTGLLHVGNARTALFNWLMARHAGGTFILRIEDTDLERSTAASERSMLEDLRWLGLAWDEGPDVGGAVGPYRQSERLAIYRQHVARLLASDRAYYCFCTAEQLEADRQRALAEGAQPSYVGRCRGLDPTEASARVQAGEAAAVRFSVEPGPAVTFVDLVRGEVGFAREVIGDPIIVRSDGTPAYNFAVVVDDALMGVTHVIRGEDHISNTPRQLLMYKALGYDAPRFAHLSLVLGPDQAPLSKRHGATSVSEFRARGFLPEAVVNYLALIGWSPGGNEEILPLDEMAHRFDIGHVGKTAGVFDPEKLAWMNRHYQRIADADRLARLLAPFLEAAGYLRSDALDDSTVAYLSRYVVPLVAGVVNRLDEAPSRVRFLFDWEAEAVAAHEATRHEFAGADARAVLSAMASLLEDGPRLLDKDAFRQMAGAVRDRTGLKGRALFHPIRMVLTGQSEGPELDLAVPAIDAGALLGRDAAVPPIVGCRERARALLLFLGA